MWKMVASTATMDLFKQTESDGLEEVEGDDWDIPPWWKTIKNAVLSASQM